MFSLEEVREAGLGFPSGLSDVPPAASSGSRGPISAHEPTPEVQGIL